jgi:hypothetical protein
MLIQSQCSFNHNDHPITMLIQSQCSSNHNAHPITMLGCNTISSWYDYVHTVHFSQQYKICSMPFIYSTYGTCLARYTWFLEINVFVSRIRILDVILLIPNSLFMIFLFFGLPKAHKKFSLVHCPIVKTIFVLVSAMSIICCNYSLFHIQSSLNIQACIDSTNIVKSCTVNIKG